jgi:HlyD family secretion protein
LDLKRLKIDRTTELPRANTAASRRGGVPLGKFVLLAAAAGAVWFFRAPLLEFADRFRLPEVQTAEVVRRSPAAAGALAGASANGYVIARVRAALSADTPGRIVELNVVEGQRIAEGFIVARLYAKELEAAFQAAEGEVAVASGMLARERAALLTADADRKRLDAAVNAVKATITEAEADATLWKLELERMKNLVETGAENQQELDQAEAEWKAANARVASAIARAEAAEAEAMQSSARRAEQERAIATAEAQVRAREAQRDESAARLDKTIIRAPFDGIVVLKDAEVGEVVSPNVQAGGNARGSVVTMVDFASLEMQLKVPEASLALVELGAPATVFLDAYPGVAYPAIVDRIWPTADRKEGTIEVRAKFLTPDDRLRPEMAGRIVFGAESKPGASDAPRPDVLLVPARAIVRQDGKSYVFVVERGQVAARAVELGEKIGDSFVVIAGVGEDDRVVIDVPTGLEDGGRVRVAP